MLSIAKKLKGTPSNPRIHGLDHESTSMSPLFSDALLISFLSERASFAPKMFIILTEVDCKHGRRRHTALCQKLVSSAVATCLNSRFNVGGILHNAVVLCLVLH